MTAERDGGPAFPNITPDMLVPGSPGMSLRDLFAAHAMQGFCAAGVDWWPDMHGPEWSKHAAVGAYEIADALLRVREDTKL